MVAMKLKGIDEAATKMLLWQISSIFSEESIAKLTSLRTNYETAKKEVEIEYM